MGSYHIKKLSYSGLTAELVRHEGPPPQWVLIIDGSLHSSVDIEDPSKLYFNYSQKLGSIVETLFPEKEKLSTLHLGAGALSIARYIEATRPGSPQVAVEIETDLLDFVEATIPLANRENMEFLTGDAREVVIENKKRFANKFDLIVVEIFLERTTPAHVTSSEFYDLLLGTLKQEGVVIINVIDADPYKYASNQLVTLKNVFGNVKAVIDKEDYEEKIFTNILMVASRGKSLDLLSDYSKLFPRAAVIIQEDSAAEWEAIGQVIYDKSSTDWETETKWVIKENEF
jgi:hypothetical protein